MRIYFIFSTVLLLMLSSTYAQTNSPVVKIRNGQLQGSVENGVQSFKGIPFAAPPTGKFRWREPQPVTNWTGVHDAKEFGPTGMQTNVFGDMAFRAPRMSEDCLYLNVWTPDTRKKNLPVLVYFYGGGFVAGDGSEARYDGASMAAKGMVALTVNYRLGIFGHMAHPELTKESPDHASGNYGMLDQVAALKWVQENIAAFGGDPKRVTIAGESAGSMSVSALMASPLSKNLFAQAIGESGSMLGSLASTPLAKSEQVGLEFASEVGANSLEALRSIPAEKLLALSMAGNPFRFQIVTIDGYFFPKHPLEIFEKGEQAQVPLLAGWNSEEMTYRVLLGEQPLTIENYTKAVQRAYPEQASELLKVYKPNSDAAVEQVATDLAGDKFIGFSTWKWIDVQTKTGKPVYRYLYSRPRPPMSATVGNASAGLAGGIVKDSVNTKPVKREAAKRAVHSAEIEYAMGNLATNKVYDWTPDDYKVSKLMQEYFANFIKTGNPNGTGLPHWPTVTTGGKVQYINIDVTTKLEVEKNRDRYIYLDKVTNR